MEVSLFLHHISTYFYSVTLCYGTMFVCLSVCVYVCLLQVDVVRLDVGSRKRNHTIAQGVLFSGAKDLSEIAP